MSTLKRAFAPTQDLSRDIGRADTIIPGVSAVEKMKTIVTGLQ